MIRDRSQDLIKLVLIVLGHALQVLLQRTRIVSHPLHLELSLSVRSDDLLIRDHLLVDFVSQLGKLLRQLIMLRLCSLERVLKFDAAGLPQVNQLVLNLDLALFSRVEHIDLRVQLINLVLDVAAEHADKFGFFLIFGHLHCLLFFDHELDLLLGGLLGADLVIEHVHKVLNFVDLALDAVAVRILLGDAQIEVVIGLFDLSDGLSGCDKIAGELFGDLVALLAYQSYIVNALSVVCALFILCGVHLADDGVDLVVELATEAVKVELTPGFGTFSLGLDHVLVFRWLQM